MSNKEFDDVFINIAPLRNENKRLKLENEGLKKALDQTALKLKNLEEDHAELRKVSHVMEFSDELARSRNIDDNKSDFEKSFVGEA